MEREWRKREARARIGRRIAKAWQPSKAYAKEPRLRLIKPQSFLAPAKALRA